MQERLKECFLCSRPLTGQQTRFCSKKCRDYFWHKEWVKTTKNERAKETLTKYNLGEKSEVLTSTIPSFFHGGKVKQFKLKKSHKSKPYKYIVYKTKPSRPQERNIWRERWHFFWIRFHQLQEGEQQERYWKAMKEIVAESF